jgi:hypothetical protein
MNTFSKNDNWIKEYNVTKMKEHLKQQCVKTAFILCLCLNENK